MDSEIVEFLLNNPLFVVGFIVIGLGCFEIWQIFSEWAERTIKDYFFCKAVLYLGINLIMLLFVALLYKLIN